VAAGTELFGELLQTSIAVRNSEETPGAAQPGSCGAPGMESEVIESGTLQTASASWDKFAVEFSLELVALDVSSEGAETDSVIESHDEFVEVSAVVTPIVLLSGVRMAEGEVSGGANSWPGAVSCEVLIGRTSGAPALTGFVLTRKVEPAWN
jgi:hypothetical protein